jgi:hypothetical protein
MWMCGQDIVMVPGAFSNTPTRALPQPSFCVMAGLVSDAVTLVRMGSTASKAL